MCALICVGGWVAALAPAAAAAAGPATDPLLARQWALVQSSAIGAPQAWTRTTGQGTIIAVLDTGVQIGHPDLAGNIWTNPAEIPANGLDDDADGIVDDVHGANMIARNGDVRDDVGHGTCVAGIAAARRGNGAGGSGLAPGATIMPVKVVDAATGGTTDALARGIRYAVDRGARILNVSLAVDARTADVASAVRYAGRRGAIVVAASGNGDRDIDRLPSYPASLADPAVIGVAALTRSGLLWHRTNSGRRSVDIAAPGCDITCTTRGRGYGKRSGTSAAAPFVSASLALLAAARTDLPMRALRRALLATARRTFRLAPLVGSGRRLDVGAAVDRLLGGAPAVAKPVSRAARARCSGRLRSCRR